MPLKFCLFFLQMMCFSSIIFSQETTDPTHRNDEDSVALERRKNYEARLKYFEEIRRRRERDPQGYADSVARIREQRNFQNAESRIKGYHESNIAGLLEIDLTGARLSELPDWIYEAKNMKVLVLDNNQISRLPKRLAELDSLKRIYWRYNDLGNSKVQLPKLSGIEKLDLTGNSLDKLPKVHRFKRLRELVLENNSFDKIPTWRVRRLKRLKELDLSINPVVLDKRWYGLIDHIEILKLNKCKIKNLDPSFYKMTGLKELQIQVNDLQDIPTGISSFENLEKLSFYKNQLSKLPEDFFELSKLRVIDFYYNQFEILPAAIGRLEDLEILYFSFNKLYDVPSEIGKLKRLEELYIHHNRISEIPYNISDLKKVKTLHFQNNYVSEFPIQILEMSSLKDLDISSTDIVEIPDGITGLKLKNFYWRDLKINLNDPQNRRIGEILVKLSEQGTNVVPKISAETIAGD